MVAGKTERKVGVVFDRGGRGGLVFLEQKSTGMLEKRARISKQKWKRTKSEKSFWTITFYYLLIPALTVRFLTKRFIGEYQSLMRKYVSSNVLTFFVLLSELIYSSYPSILCWVFHTIVSKWSLPPSSKYVSITSKGKSLVYFHSRFLG